jgi:non-heme chloroperoxidase
MLAAAAVLKRLDSAAADSVGDTSRDHTEGGGRSGMITLKDGATIFFKDWGSRNAQPIMFHHGWPLSSDDWDAQMLFFVQKGYRVIAHDRRGHGRSSQVSDGHDMDHYARTLLPWFRISVCATRSTLATRLAGAKPTLCCTSRQRACCQAGARWSRAPDNVEDRSEPDGIPMEVFDGFRKQLSANRAQFYLDIASGPFFGFNRPSAKVSQWHRPKLWRQGMMGSAKAHYDGIKAFSETDFTEDLKAIDVPTLVMHGDDDQLVPIANSALSSVKLLKKGKLKIYENFRTAC